MKRLPSAGAGSRSGGFGFELGSSRDAAGVKKTDEGFRVGSLVEDRDDAAGSGLPHLSHSRTQRYLNCPEQYRLYYLENLRPKVPPATLAFDQIVHEALAGLFQKKGDPVKCFQDAWERLKDIPLDYNQRESWDKLSSSGEALLGKFVSKELPRLGEISAVEKSFALSITTLDLPFIGIIDLVGRVNGKCTVVDWKTAGSGPDAHEAAMSDLLSAYQLVEPTAEQLALCFLVKTKKPQILWQFTSRTGEQIGEYLFKMGFVWREITAGRFYQRVGNWCAGCEYLPVCLGDQRKARETLVTAP